MWQALPRLGMRYDDGASTTELWRWQRKSRAGKTEKNGDVIGLIMWLRSKKKPRHGLHRASTMPNMATTATGSQRKLAGGDSCPMALFAIIIELPLVLNSQITPKFVWQLKNLQK